MSLVGFKAQNHPQQKAKPDVDDRAIRMEDFVPLHERFRFTIDAASSPTNARLERYWTIDDDALTKSWAGERVWCNPPYSNIGAWVSKAWHEWRNRYNPHPPVSCLGCRYCELRMEKADQQLIVMLLPANRTEQRWWQDHVEPYRDFGGQLSVEFLPGRMRFERPNAVIGPKGDRPPFGCCLVIWGQP